MMDDLAFLRSQVSDLKIENINLRSENAFLKGNVEAYEWFLRRQGFIKGGEE